MRRNLLVKVLFSVLVLIVFAGLNLWGWRPFFDPDPVENGDEEIRLAPQRFTAQTTTAATNAITPGRFGGNPYLVGTPVTTTTTLPQAETNIAVNPTNPSNLVGIITDYSLRPGGDLTNGVSKYTVSNDGGMTWADSFVPIKNNAYGFTSDGVSWLVDRDPGIAIDRQNNVYFSGLYLKLGPGSASAATSSQNNLISRMTYPGGVYVCAATLPNIVMTNAQCRPVFTYTGKTGNTTSVDRDWMAADAGSASPHEGNVYVVWTHYTGCTLSTCQTKFIALSRSTDHGVTWSPILQINPASQTIVDWPMVTVGDDGTVYVAYQFYIQNKNERQHFLAVSTDGGQTFSTPVAMTPIFTNVTFNCPYRKNSAPNIVVSPVAGREYVYDVWAEQTGSSSSIAVARSRQTKGGGGFTTPVSINDSTAGQREYAAAAVDGNGTLHAIWLDTRNSPTDTSQYDVYATYSKNLAANFTPNARVTPSTINGNTSFIGDFFGLTVEPATGIAHASWSNGGLIDGQLITTTLTPQ
ncbi:MAG TPA: sialidase family protein [Terriglobales bacterium]|nr:sialidase family protein [Terriglobales bacterium]